jgi:hypothetical protein
MVHCPAHDDSNPSLEVIAKGGRVILVCYAGCTYDEILDALRTRPAQETVRYATITEPLKFEKAYTYHDADGERYMQVRRFVQRGSGKKSFRQFRWDAEKARWRMGLRNLEPILYRLPQLLDGIAQGRTVFVVEGEKDADRVREVGYVATTNPMGAGKWRDSYTEVLRGADVVVIADNDDPGMAHARTVSRELDAPILIARQGNDVSDHLDAGHALDDLVEVE